MVLVSLHRLETGRSATILVSSATGTLIAEGMDIPDEFVGEFGLVLLVVRVDVAARLSAFRAIQRSTSGRDGERKEGQAY